MRVAFYWSGDRRPFSVVSLILEGALHPSPATRKLILRRLDSIPPCIPGLHRVGERGEVCLSGFRSSPCVPRLYRMEGERKASVGILNCFLPGDFSVPSGLFFLVPIPILHPTPPLSFPTLLPAPVSSLFQPSPVVVSLVLTWLF